MIVNALFTEVEKRDAPVRTGIDGGVGPVRHPVSAHAHGEPPPGIQHLLHHGLWTVAGQHALLGLLLQRPAGVREQVLAVSLGRLELGAADPE
jgi:hypothetical protein